MTGLTGSSSLFLPDAPSHPGWHDVDWRHAYQEVRQLQIRIVKATQQRQYRKVKNLQRLLTHSMAAKLLAVRRVTENSGKNTPGVDGVLLSTPQDKMEAVHSLHKRGYQPLPLRRVYIPKASNPAKKRPLGIPTMIDRSMQALHLLALEPVTEVHADPHSYGFRKNRSAQDALQSLFGRVSSKRGAKVVLEADIRACFDEISHDWLIANIPMDTTILRKWLKAGYLEKRVFHETTAGTPQGGIASPTLANAVLDGLERKLAEKFKAPSDGKNPNKVHLVRYADDFVITGTTQEVLEREVKPLVQEFLQQRGLELSEEKTRITPISKGFDFLGFHVRQYGEKVLTRPSQKALQSLQSKVKSLLKEMQTANVAKMLKKLNPILQGWANYFRHAASKQTFIELEHWLFTVLQRWTKRRHPGKTRGWIKARYYQHLGNRQVFCGKTQDSASISLFRLSTVPIRRHILIQSEANPFDPTWEVYFEQRMTRQWLEGRQKGKLTMLHGIQNGRCPVCMELLAAGEEFHVHHKIPRVEGGPDTLDNLVLLHPNCHRQFHHGFAVLPGVERHL